MSAPAQITILIPDPDEMMFVTGSNDTNIDRIEREFAVKIVSRGAELRITGEPANVARVGELVGAMRTLSDRDENLRKPALERLIDDAKEAPVGAPEQLREVVATTVRGKRITPQSANQRRYVEAIRGHDLVFATGPAGTGKSYLAVALGVAALRDRKVARLILTRPAVEAGERLGFLPGDLTEKIDPYLRPLYDALYELMPPERFTRAMERGEIEVAPLAFMRGRAQPLFSKVLTPSGFTTIGDLSVGDLVVGSDGRPTAVLGVYPQGRKPVYRVQTQDGASTLACGEHLWAVTTPSDRRRGKPPQIVQTRDMVGRLRSAHQHRYELPLLSRPVEFERSHILMDPYALGLQLGDGCVTTSTSPSFAAADQELVLALESRSPDTEIVRTTEMDHVLRRRGGGRGGQADTFVPTEYLYNVPDVRLAVMQGLLDTDGGPVTPDGRTCRIQYTTTSPRLREDMVFLVRSFGGVAHWRTRRAQGRKPGRARGRDVHNCSDAYVVDIRLPAGIPPFRLARKRDLYDAHGGGRPMRFIDSVEPAGEQETICIKVAAADSLYITNDFMVTHNTLNEAFIILDEAQNATPAQMKMFLTRLGYGSQAVVNGDITQIDLEKDQRSGLVVGREILRGVEGIAFVDFEDRDVVRHELVARIVRAYDRYEKQ
ncbi:MAG TPA: PhoH family protein [Candidatus Limnocylindria bacterium]|jgi:phosphate starvation-inducible PhoH-like protein|nr:PhoH family protein [Candidatus Limnocylindria bacterium]